jgi:FMN phosphatase YigB (HAD superfamily)
MIKNIIFDLEGVLLDWENSKMVLWRNDIVELLKTLEGFDLHCLTNILPRSGSYFDNSIYGELKLLGFCSELASLRSKFQKPHLEFYQELVSSFDLEPLQCIFIDDKDENVRAAIKLGMKGIRNNKNTDLEKELTLIIQSDLFI